MQESAKPVPAAMLPVEAHLVVVRTKEGKLVPTVDGKPLAGCVALSTWTNAAECGLTMAFNVGLVHFETESALEPRGLN